MLSSDFQTDNFFPRQVTLIDATSGSLRLARTDSSKALVMVYFVRHFSDVVSNSKHWFTTSFAPESKA